MKILSGKYEDSFAFQTLSKRIPIMLTKTIDSLCRNNISSEIIKEISALKSELVRNKEFSPLKHKIVSTDSSLLFSEIELHLWNERISMNNETFFSAPFLFSECYIYRRLFDIFNGFPLNFDWFEEMKRESFSFNDVVPVGHRLCALLSTLSNDFDIFSEFLRYSLWGNQADLSMNVDDDCCITRHNSKSNLSSFILIDDSLLAWERISSYPNKPIVFLLDNSGVELFMDLCLADYFLSFNKTTACVYFYVKCFPWFVSDTTFYDVEWLLNHLELKDDKEISKLVSRWRKYILDSKWIFKSHLFLSSFYPFQNSLPLCDDLFQLDASIYIFKGDLNYRKLVNDVKLDNQFISSFRDCVALKNVPILSLRTAKCDVICGLKEGQAEMLDKAEGISSGETQNWLVNGKYAVINYTE
jgi:hypothetical protein